MLKVFSLPTCNPCRVLKLKLLFALPPSEYEIITHNHEFAAKYKIQKVPFIVTDDEQVIYLKDEINSYVDKYIADYIQRQFNNE